LPFRKKRTQREAIGAHKRPRGFQIGLFFGCGMKPKGGVLKGHHAEGLKKEGEETRGKGGRHQPPADTGR